MSATEKIQFFSTIIRNLTNTASVLIDFVCSESVSQSSLQFFFVINRFQAFPDKYMFLFCIFSLASYLRVATESPADL